TRRAGEKNIGYAESHDQALVGDKTLMFWLADAAMYDKMDTKSDSLVIDRAMALHKMIRLVTFSLAGEGYLNFMGNEFGHPEWLDFPREGNNDSFQHARRIWSLRTNPDLRFRYLEEFDKEMVKLESLTHFMETGVAEQKWIQNDDKLLAYQKGNLLFAFNFHPTETFDLEFPIKAAPELLIDTDNGVFGGFGPRNSFSYDEHSGVIRMKLVSRSGFVFRLLP
ncbi:MAG: alpha amylase C-terminal domain-containing protein, partial [Streptococcaceae bacterium]|nr:alpha amylase C-terminal domain-containing protein [Streptococcaceae bacterium]